jgi:hypothetical protein
MAEYCHKQKRLALRDREVAATVKIEQGLGFRLELVWLPRRQTARAASRGLGS